MDFISPIYSMPLNGYKIQDGILYGKNGYPLTSGTISELLTEVYENAYSPCVIGDGLYYPLTKIRVRPSVTLKGESFGGVKFIMPDGLDDALFDGSNGFAWNTYDNSFENLLCDGNGVGQTAGADAPFINLYVTSAGIRGYTTIIKNVHVTSCARSGIDIESPSYPVLMDTVWFDAVNGAVSWRALKINCSDSWFNKLRFGGQYGIGMYVSGNSIKILESYFGGTTTTAYGAEVVGRGLYAVALRGVIAGCVFDHNYRNAIYTEDSANSYASATRLLSIHDNKFTNNSQTAIDPNTHDVIRLEGHTHHVTLSNNHFFSDEANLPKYLVNEEDANCDYNHLGYGGVYLDYVTAKTRVQGAHTHNVTDDIDDEA